MTETAGRKSMSFRQRLSASMRVDNISFFVGWDVFEHNRYAGAHTGPDWPDSEKELLLHVGFLQFAQYVSLWVG